MPRLLPEGQPGGHDDFRQHVPAGAVAQVDFVAQLARPAGARDDQRNTLQRDLAQPVIAQLQDVLAKKRLHDLARLRPLQLQRRDVRLGDGDIEARIHGHALRPEQNVAVRQRDPEMVLGQEWFQKAEGLGADLHAIDQDLRSVMASAASEVREGLCTFLLSQDPQRYAWARRWIGSSDPDGKHAIKGD